MSFPNFQFPLKTKQIDNRLYVLDVIRKKYILLTPEEWVRQHVVYQLIHKQHIAMGRIAVERMVKNTNKRFDILIHSKDTGLPELIIECKSYKEKIGQSTFNQIGQYNLQLNVPYLVITNWHNWMAAEIKKGEQTFTFLDSFPQV